MYTAHAIKSIRNSSKISDSIRQQESESILIPDRANEFRQAGHSCLTCKHFQTGRMTVNPTCAIKPGKTPNSKKPVRAYNICGKWIAK